MSIEPSVEPLSATTTSPRRPADLNASSALPTQMPMEFASLRHGMTTETSTGFSAASGGDERRRVCLGGFGCRQVRILSRTAIAARVAAAFLCNFRVRHYHGAFAASHSVGLQHGCTRSEALRIHCLTYPTPQRPLHRLRQVPAVTRSGGGLLKVLGMWFGIAAAVGNTIAAGIVRSPGDIAQWLPNIYLFFGVWIIGGLYALVGASSMAELGGVDSPQRGPIQFLPACHRRLRRLHRGME